MDGENVFSSDSQTENESRLSAQKPGNAGEGANGIRVVFRDLTYTVVNQKNKKEKIQLLKNISGCFSPNQMSALMGPSGSGKTTMLDVIAGRKTTGEVSGEVLFSAHKPSINFLRRYTGYVEQFDTLVDTLTVREMLLYTAELKRSIKEPLADKAKIVDHFIDRLGLERCQHTRIGNSLNRGISGGQAKRTNVAIAMVSTPRILFLDEPTSGLDSYTSNEVMTVVKSLIQDSAGITICATIHSPSPYTFALFERLMVLVRGEVVYHGPNGESMVEYFTTGCGVAPPKTALEGANINNNADFLTDLIVGADREGRAHEYAEAYAKSEVKRSMMEIVDRNAQKDTLHLSAAEEKDLNVSRATATPLWKGLKTMIKYRTSRNYRDGEFLGPRIGDKFVFAFLIATLYLGIGDDFGENNLTNVAAVLFMWTALPAFGAASYVPSLTLEKPLYVRERSDGLYRPITYLLAKFFDEFFVTILASIVFACLVYFVVDFQGEWVLFWLVYLVTLMIGISMAYVIATISPNMDVANAALPAYTVTLLFFAGFLMRFDDMPDYWKWYSYINFLRYAWSALMVNQFEDRPDVMVGDEPILKFYDLDGTSKWEYLGIECIFFVVFFVGAWAALQFKTLNKR